MTHHGGRLADRTVARQFFAVLAAPTTMESATAEWYSFQGDATVADSLPWDSFVEDRKPLAKRTNFPWDAQKMRWLLARWNRRSCVRQSRRAHIQNGFNMMEDTFFVSSCWPSLASFFHCTCLSFKFALQKPACYLVLRCGTSHRLFWPVTNARWKTR